jgi:sodium/potassium/calcium exchanger 6
LTSTAPPSTSPSSGKNEPGNCEDLEALDGAEAKCAYILSHTPCALGVYIDYLRLFYCGFGAAPAAVGYAAFLLWLLVLFYLPRRRRRGCGGAERVVRDL